MDFNKYFFNFFASFTIVLRRFFYLLFSPYKTMRKIALDKDKSQVFIILGFVLLYFYASGMFKENIFIYYLAFLFNFSFTILFFYILAKFFKKDIALSSFITTFSYSLFPTLVWFVINLTLYLVLPPPRTTSILGKSFSIFFISFSLALFFWKIILTYLALRFSTRMHFYRIAYFIILYGLYIIPFAYLMYNLGISKIPFI